MIASSNMLHFFTFNFNKLLIIEENILQTKDSSLQTYTCQCTGSGLYSHIVAAVHCSVSPSVCRLIGRHTAHDLAAFAKESTQTPARVLGPKDFPHPVTQSGKPWFVDFFAPVSIFVCHQKCSVCQCVLLKVAWSLH